MPRQGFVASARGFFCHDLGLMTAVSSRWAEGVPDPIALHRVLSAICNSARLPYPKFAEVRPLQSKLHTVGRVWGSRCLGYRHTDGVPPLCSPLGPTCRALGQMTVRRCAKALIGGLQGSGAGSTSCSWCQLLAVQETSAGDLMGRPIAS